MNRVLEVNAEDLDCRVEAGELTRMQLHGGSTGAVQTATDQAGAVARPSGRKVWQGVVRCAKPDADSSSGLPDRAARTPDRPGSDGPGSDGARLGWAWL